MRYHFLNLIVAIVLLPGVLQAEQFDEQTVKAGFVVNFLKFVTWPEGAGPMNLCLLVDDKYNKKFELAKGRFVQNRPIRVLVPQESQLEECNVVFHSSPIQSTVRQNLLERSVLTIADSNNADPTASMIHFFSEGRQIRFGVNLQLLRKAGLVVSSRFLSLAKIVQGDDL